MGSALVACLAIGIAGSAHAATLDFTGALSLTLGYYPPFVIPGTGTAQVSGDGSAHLLALSLVGGSFGPVTTSIPLTSQAELSSIRFTGVRNLSGSFSGLSGGPSGGGPMGVAGIQKICMMFNCGLNISIPLSPTIGGAGFGLGGMRTVTGAVNLTLQHAPWTIGQPPMTLHTPGSAITTPVLPGGFAHGPASLTSSTARLSGVVQLVTVSKVYTSLTGASPELPLTGVLTLHFVPEPGTLLLLGSGALGLGLCGRRRRKR